MTEVCNYCKDTRLMINDLKTDWKAEIKELRSDIKNLGNRLPIWAIITLNILTLFLGISVGMR